MSAAGTIEKHYRTKDAAELLSVHPRTVSQWITDGTLSPVVFLGEREARIPMSTLTTFLRQRTVRRAPQAR